MKTSRWTVGLAMSLCACAISACGKTSSHGASPSSSRATDPTSTHASATSTAAAARLRKLVENADLSTDDDGGRLENFDQLGWTTCPSDPPSDRIFPQLWPVAHFSGAGNLEPLESQVTDKTYGPGLDCVFGDPGGEADWWLSLQVTALKTPDAKMGPWRNLQQVGDVRQTRASDDGGATVAVGQSSRADNGWISIGLYWTDGTAGVLLEASGAGLTLEEAEPIFRAAVPQVLLATSAMPLSGADQP